MNVDKLLTQIVDAHSKLGSKADQKLAEDKKQLVALKADMGIEEGDHVYFETQH